MDILTGSPGLSEQIRLMRELDSGALAVSAFGTAWLRARRRSLSARERVRAPLESLLDEVFWALEDYPFDPTLRDPGDRTDEEVLALVRSVLRRLPRR